MTDGRHDEGYTSLASLGRQPRHGFDLRSPFLDSVWTISLARTPVPSLPRSHGRSSSL